MWESLRSYLISYRRVTHSTSVHQCGIVDGLDDGMTVTALTRPHSMAVKPDRHDAQDSSLSPSGVTSAKLRLPTWRVRSVFPSEQTLAKRRGVSLLVLVPVKV